MDTFHRSSMGMMSRLDAHWNLNFVQVFLDKACSTLLPSRVIKTSETSIFISTCCDMDPLCSARQSSMKALNL